MAKLGQEHRAVYQNLYAHTAPGENLPEYISVNRVDGGVAFTVRGTAAYGGHTAQIILDDETFRVFQRSIKNAKV